MPSVPDGGGSIGTTGEPAVVADIRPEAESGDVTGIVNMDTARMLVVEVKVAPVLQRYAHGPAAQLGAPRRQRRCPSAFMAVAITRPISKNSLP